MTKISNQYSLTNILTADLANSRLGINNVSPTVALDVTGAGKFSSSLSALSLDVISSSGVGSSTASGLARFITAGTTAGVSIGQSNSGRRLDLLSYGLSITGTDAFITNTGANATIFENNGTERMRIFANGNIAIGSSSDNGNKFQVTGAISASGNINGSNIGGSSFSMGIGSTFNYGTGYLKSSNSTTVSTSTTTIYTSTNIGGVLSGNLVVVTGVRSGNGVNFVDLILYMNSGSISVISSQTFASPPSRNYSVNNENLNLSMASGTYVVACVALIQGYTNP